jgi:hypothetical protein
MTQPDLRFPIGKYSRPKAELSGAERTALIDAIAELPAKLRAALKGLNEKQVATPYREGGWTVRQVVHHLADSHMNAYIRFKFALTEDMPEVKPYDEAKWAEMTDAKNAPVTESLSLLEALHSRWVMTLRAMTPSDFLRKLNHPEWSTPPDLDAMLAMYGWHSRHHTAHITELRKREGWN